MSTGELAMTLTSYAIDGLGERELAMLLEGRSAWDNSLGRAQ